MNQTRLMQIVKSPLVSEKSAGAADSANQFTFRVVTDASKPEIKRAVELMFDVEVVQVRVMNVKGKAKRFGRTLGKRNDWRKAMVRLKPGQDIDFAGGA